MNLSEMMALVRVDLRDNISPYRWADEEIEKHLRHALADFSAELPEEALIDVDTVNGSMDIALPEIEGLISLEAVEYPIGRIPPRLPSYSLWANSITLTSGEIPDGSPARVYYSRQRILDSSASTIPGRYESLVASGAAGYAAMGWAAYAINRVNVGGGVTPQELLAWAKEKLTWFESELRQCGKNHSLKLRRMYPAGYENG